MIKDGEVLRLGPIAITAIATPGHTMGGTSWRWKSCEGKKCQSIVFADSISAVSADDYRFSDHPALIAVFRSTFDRIAALGCDFADAASGGSGVFERLSGAEPSPPPASAPLCQDRARAPRRPAGEREDGQVATGWKLTLPCTRDEAEAIGELDVETLGLDPPPTLMTREPDESRPDEWLLEAYFEGKPDAVAVARIGA